MFGNVFHRKHLLETRIHGVNKRLELVDSLHLCRLEWELQHEYNKVLSHEELLLYQKLGKNGSALERKILHSFIPKQ